MPGDQPPTTLLTQARSRAFSLHWLEPPAAAIRCPEATAANTNCRLKKENACFWPRDLLRQYLYIRLHLSNHGPALGPFEPGAAVGQWLGRGSAIGTIAYANDARIRQMCYSRSAQIAGGLKSGWSPKILAAFAESCRLRGNPMLVQPRLTRRFKIQNSIIWSNPERRRRAPHTWQRTGTGLNLAGAAGK
jgi:hypothetical protein